jgi:uncharacterized RDD family membrane protein YckC
MKCPKCEYLGFEQVERCRNCGYDFSLSTFPSLPELPIRIELTDTIQPLADLTLTDPAGAGNFESIADVSGGLNRASGSKRSGVLPELPLFGDAIADDAPLITRASSPRQPLSVRRATSDLHRGRPEQRPFPTGTTPMLDLELADDTAVPQVVLSGARPKTSLSERRAHLAVGEPAALGARVLAVVIDLLVLAAIDCLVIYFTMQICGLTVEDLGILPKGPLLAFLLVQNGGYLVAFNAGGQTLGKMVMGIRVVSSHPDASIDLGHSMVRTIVWVLLAVPAGLGFVTTLFSRDRRGLHDRCAGTRVVRAGGLSQAPVR